MTELDEEDVLGIASKGALGGEDAGEHDKIVGDLLRGREASIVKRESSATTSSATAGTTSCGPKDTTGACQRYVGATDNTTVPIVIGVVVPLVIALVIFLILHRRHVRKLRQEDARDQSRELDFGLSNETPGILEKNETDALGMSVSDVHSAIRHDRGLSMDMAMGNPYILPPEVHQSRESLHSLSRSALPGDDKYRATTYIPDDGSLRSPSIMRSPMDDSSSFTGSSRRFDAQPTKTFPRTQRLGKGTMDVDRAPPPISKTGNLLPPTAHDAPRDSYVSTASNDHGVAALRKSNDYLGQFIRGGVPSPTLVQKAYESKAEYPADTKAVSAEAPRKPSAAVLTDSTSKRQSKVNTLPQAETTEAFSFLPPRRESKPSHLSFIESYDHSPDDSGYASTEHTTANRSDSAPTPPQHSVSPSAQHSHRPSLAQSTQHSSQQQEQGEYYDDYYEEPNSHDIAGYGDDLGYDPRHLDFVRPLPPDDPSENPEQRANRIRSFYKEYFDETKSPNPNQKQHVSYFDGSEAYPNNGMPQAQQPRAPYPPRAFPPRNPAYRGPPQGRHRATVSNGSYMSGSRTYSTQSGQFGAPRRLPQKNVPPPQPLTVLPTPSMLKDDNISFSDFAPPSLAKGQRSGTPDSSRGGKVPYASSVRAYNPLVSSYDDLAVIPSPHALRNSGTYSGLDFAPPRFANPDTGSDAGSIQSGRSNRSGVSAIHARNIRQGAYRVENLPKNNVGAKNDLATALRPQWDIR